MKLWMIVEGQPAQLMGELHEGSTFDKAYGVRTCDGCGTVEHLSFCVPDKDNPHVRYEMQMAPEEIQVMDEFVGQVLQAELERKGAKVQ